MHQDLLRRLAQNLGIQVEKIAETSHALVDILTPSVPSRIALPLDSAILEPGKALWQTPALAARIMALAVAMRRSL